MLFSSPIGAPPAIAHPAWLTVSVALATGLILIFEAAAAMAGFSLRALTGDVGEHAWRRAGRRLGLAAAAAWMLSGPPADLVLPTWLLLGALGGALGLHAPVPRRWANPDWRGARGSLAAIALLAGGALLWAATRVHELAGALDGALIGGAALLVLARRRGGALPPQSPAGRRPAMRTLVIAAGWGAVAGAALARSGPDAVSVLGWLALFSIGVAAIGELPANVRRRLSTAARTSAARLRRLRPARLGLRRPARAHDVRSMTARVHVQRFGEDNPGPVVLLVRGNLGRRDLWIPVVERLVRRGYVVVCPDAPWNVRGVRPRGRRRILPFAFAQLSGVLDLIEERYPGREIFGCGHSFGGGFLLWASQRLAAHDGRPARLSGILAITPAGLVVQPLVARFARVASSITWIPAAHWGLAVAAQLFSGHIGTAFAEFADGLKTGARAFVALRFSPRVLRELLAALPGPPSPIPTATLYCRDDSVVDSLLSSTLAGMWHVPSTMLDKGGHEPHVRRPRAVAKWIHASIRQMQSDRRSASIA